MIKLEELNPHKYATTPEIDANLNTLLTKLNKVRSAYNTPMIVSSGLRDNAQQQALIAAGKSKASKSKHLTGEAADILDKDGKLKDWINNNVELMETIGVWFEDFGYTKNWVHIQIVKPLSGRRFFIP